jgi:hypothetical protein
MSRISAGLRNWAGALAACMLAVLVLGPALDSAVCKDEAVALSVQGAAHAAVADRVSAEHHSKPAGHCPPGHCFCHQTSSEAPAVASVEASARTDRQVYRLAALSVPISNRQFRLIRPPRA